MQIKSVLITGVTGFVGSHLCRRLLKENAFEVHAIVRPTSKFAQLDGLTNKICLHVHDGTTQGMVDILGNAKPDLVFHLASRFISEHISDDIERLVKSNILFGAQLVEAMTSHGFLNLINTGTSWQHYQDNYYSPVNLYAATKQAFEAIVQFYIEAHGLRVVTIKLFDTYGPNDPRPKLMNLLRRIAQSGEELSMSAGEQLIDIVHIEDVLDAYLCAANRLLSGKVDGHEQYAVSSGRPIKLRELVKIFEEVYGKKLSINWGARPYRKREVMVPWSKGKLLPGWKAKVEIEEGIKNFLGL